MTSESTKSSSNVAITMLLVASSNFMADSARLLSRVSDYTWITNLSNVWLQSGFQVTAGMQTVYGVEPTFEVKVISGTAKAKVSILQAFSTKFAIIYTETSSSSNLIRRKESRYTDATESSEPSNVRVCKLLSCRKKPFEDTSSIISSPQLSSYNSRSD